LSLSLFEKTLINQVFLQPKESIVPTENHNSLSLFDF
jgi:hypothetical protein